MQHTTGFTKDEIYALCGLVRRETADAQETVWPPILGLFKAVVVTLTYLRRNRVQAELAETFGVSQPTISRAISGLTPVLGRVLADYVPVAEDLDPRTGYIVDGTLLPCWSWHGQQQLYSGKHHTTGLNVQVACDLTGRLAWISDPVDGCRHDTAALRDSGVLNTLDASKWMGDKGFVGNGMVTPIKKPAHRKLLDWEQEVQQAGQPDPLPHRTDHRQLQDLAHPPHRLPPTSGNIHHNHLNRHCTPLLQDLL